MKSLKNINKAVFEIVTLLLQNDNIKKLLFWDSADALSLEVPDISIQRYIDDKYIWLYPAVETGIQNFERNTFLIVNLEEINLRSMDANTSASGAIYVTTDAKHSLLDNNQLRLLVLADEVRQSLDNHKLSAAGELQINSIRQQMISEFRSAYRISFSLSDQSTRKAEI